VLTVLVQSLVLASGGFLSVGSITIVILMLLSDRGWRNGVAYVLGYWGGYSSIGVAVILVGRNMASGGTGDGGMVSSVVIMMLGGLLLWLAWRNWRKPPAGGQEQEQDHPGFFSMLDGITPLKALGFGAMVTVVNFKNLAIFLSAVSVSLLSDLALATKLMIVLLVALVFCAAVMVPVLIYLSFPAGAQERLTRFKLTLEKYSRPIGIGAPLVFGLLFVVRGITGLL